MNMYITAGSLARGSYVLRVSWSGLRVNPSLFGCSG